MESERKKILVVRPDRIGDVVLSTPVFEALKHQFSNAEIHVLVRDMVAPAVEHNPHLSKTLVYRPGSLHQGVGGLLRLTHEIRQEKYDAAVVLQVAFKPSMAVALAGIPERIGPFSKWYSFLAFNRGMRQRRSAVEMHEADYNLMLLRKLGVRAPSRHFEPTVIANAEAKERMRVFVRGLGVEDGESFVVIHPGMGGSALNWPEGYYVDLIQRLASKGIKIIVTGSVAEKALVERVLLAAQPKAVEPLSGHYHVGAFSFLGSQSPSGLADLIALLSLAKVVVAPSTGPLHLAVALGKKTVSFYPPVKVQSALRWGPYSTVEEAHTVLVPDALCGQDFKCIGRKCRFFFCMERLGVEEAVHGVLTQLESKA